MVDETERDEHRAASGSEDWRRWWEEHGERELRCILMTAWDPVGAGDAPEAWDEYDGYMAGVAHRLRDTEGDDEAANTVAAFLNHIERDYMSGLTPAAERRNSFLAETLLRGTSGRFFGVAVHRASGSTTTESDWRCCFGRRMKVKSGCCAGHVPSVGVRGGRTEPA